MKSNKSKVFRSLGLFIIIFPLLSFWHCHPSGGKHVLSQMRYDSLQVDAPFPMPVLKIPVFPSRVIKITQYGAVEGGTIKNTKAIEKAILACYDAGGGIVLVPAGKWLTGKVHLKSNINLHLDEGAELIFSDDPNDNLPAVLSSWEGLECYNYSPLIYAYDCENVAVTGKGTVIALLDSWKIWYLRPPAHMEALKHLYIMAAKGVPVKDRQMAVGENHLRPQFIQFNRCRNVLLEGISIRNSPFWTVHILLCNGVVVRGLNVYAHGHNNDGIDPEMTKNMLVENCTFDQGDDAIAIKAGRDMDGWRLNTPCENIVMRNCIVKEGHVMVALGSELSGGIRNIYVYNFKIQINDSSSLSNILRIKTNEQRGGFVENIYIENIDANKTEEGILQIQTDYAVQWKNLIPVYERRLTRIENIRLKNIHVGQTKTPISIYGNKEKPVKNITLENITVNKISEKLHHIENAENIKGEVQLVKGN